MIWDIYGLTTAQVRLRYGISKTGYKRDDGGV